MNIILNVDAITHPITGIGQYAQQLGHHLSLHPKVSSMRFFAANRWLENIENTADNNKWLGLARRYMPFKSWALSVYHRRRNHNFAALTEGLEDHLLHSPNFILMPHAGPKVVTVHDLAFIHYHDTLPAYRRHYLDTHFPASLDSANRIIVPTISIKNELIATFDCHDESIDVTPLGVREHLRPLAAVETRETLQKIGLEYRQFVLSVATQEPRKNLVRLVEAYQLLPIAERRRCPLVLVGAKGWLNGPLEQQIKPLLKEGSIIPTGYISNQQLHHLYASACCLAMPSLYEGFGLPIIEAMAAGCPVITSDRGAMQEVAGGKAVLCNPEDSEHIKEALHSVIDDETLQEQVATMALPHAAEFSWQRCADETIAVYQAAINSNG